MVPLVGVPLAPEGAGAGTVRPRVVLGPVVDSIPSLFAVQEPDLDERVDECIGVAGPVNGQLDVFGGHAGKVTVRAIGSSPQEEHDEPPCATLTEAANQPLRLRVRRQRRAQARII
jgi:hypothetical protein